MENLTIKKLKGRLVKEAMELAHKVFDDDVVKYCTAQGAINFKRNIVQNKKYILSCQKGFNLLYGAIFDKNVIGVIGMNKYRNHISIAFVQKEYQRNKVGSSIFTYILKDIKKSHQEINEITLSSVPCGIAFYKSLGFITTGEEEEVNGIMVTPMKYTIKEGLK